MEALTLIIDLKDSWGTQMITETKILFICTANVSRSKMGEYLYQNDYDTKSAGFDVFQKGTIAVNSQLLDWADLIVVFEEEHVKNIMRDYPKQYFTKRIINLEIPDKYAPGSEALRELLPKKLNPILQNISDINTHIIRHKNYFKTVKINKRDTEN